MMVGTAQLMTVRLTAGLHMIINNLVSLERCKEPSRPSMHDTQISREEKVWRRNSLESYKVSNKRMPSPKQSSSDGVHPNANLNPSM